MTDNPAPAVKNETAGSPFAEEAPAALDRQPQPGEDFKRGMSKRPAFTLNLESAIYILFILIALATRFYDLGSRPLHHDESLHALFSWRYYIGQGYIHNPMMHGPWQFHINALMMFLFGAGNYSARIAAALFGVLMVGLPLFLRKELGRWGALFASLLLLVSPSFLYFSRFTREDIYAVTFTMILFIAIIRYMDRPQARWLYTGSAALALLFATKEISFIVMFVFGSFLLLAVLWQASRASFAAVLSYGCAALLVVMSLPSLAGLPPMPSIPLDSPTAANIIRFLGQTLTHPLILVLIALTAAMVSFVAIILHLRRGWLFSLAGGAEGATGWSPIRSLGDTIRHPVPLAAAILIFAGITVVLFTSLFSNMAGLGTGFIGSLGYWLAQHGVERGKQPWFYYLFLIPLYEPLPLLLAVGGGVLLGGRRLLRRLTGKRKWLPVVPRQNAAAPIVVFLAYWAGLSFVIYSWAGEKMPWLMLHMVLPITLLAALFIGRALATWLDRHESVLDRAVEMPVSPQRALPGVAVLAGCLVLIGIWFAFTINETSYSSKSLDWRPMLMAVGAVAVAFLVARLSMPARPVAQGGLAALLFLGLAFQIHTAWNFSFSNGAVPVEMGVYVQTSPDVTHVMDHLSRMSVDLTGRSDIKVIYDSTVAWPFEWYLRDFKNKTYMPNGPTDIADAPVVLVGADHQPAVAQYLQNYVEQRYVLRWWFPEDTYRAFLPPGDYQGKPFTYAVWDQAKMAAGSLATLANPDERAKLWRYFVYREPYSSLGSTDFYLYVRKDLAPYWYSLDNH